jgi:hypothetical protein
VVDVLAVEVRVAVDLDAHPEAPRGRDARPHRADAGDVDVEARLQAKLRQRAGELVVYVRRP